jgi:hypothetical protein
MTRTVAALAVLLVAVLAAPALAQEATPPPKPIYPGELWKAERDFQNRRLVGTVEIDCQAISYDTAGNASTSIGIYADYLPTVPGIVDLKPASFPSYHDETKALAATIQNEGTTITAAIVVVRKGEIIWSFIAYALAGDTFDDLETVTANLFARPMPKSTGDLQKDLFALLPTIEDMPTGFVVSAETFAPGNVPGTPVAAS